MQCDQFGNVYTAGQAKRGEASYGKVCACCDSDEFEVGEVARPLCGDDFMSTRVGHTIGVLFYRICIRCLRPSLEH